MVRAPVYECMGYPALCKGSQKHISFASRPLHHECEQVTSLSSLNRLLAEAIIGEDSPDNGEMQRVTHKD